MNRYTFCLPKKELKEFSIRAVLEQYHQMGPCLGDLLPLCVLEAFISPAFGVVILFLFAGGRWLICFAPAASWKRNISWKNGFRGWRTAPAQKIVRAAQGKHPAAASIILEKKQKTFSCWGIPSRKGRLYGIPCLCVCLKTQRSWSGSGSFSENGKPCRRLERRNGAAAADRRCVFLYISGG